MSSGRNNHHNMEQDDTDLSFEALTFGGSDNHNELSPTDSPVQRKEPKSSKKSPNVRSPVQEQEKEKGTTSVYISTQGENKIDVQSLLKRVELFGTVKAHYFREKQNFGFVQFLDASAVDAVIDDLNKNGVDGVPILAEKAVVSKTTGRASPTSVGGTPFSPSTPMTPSIHSGSSIGSVGLFSSTPNGTSLFSANNSSLLPQVGPEKPDTILVLKNLPFSLKQDQLQEILMQMNSNAPQSINLHFDNLGVFRGMAFIKYRNLDDAIKVFDNLNGYDVGGRKVRVEYKRKNKGQPSDVPQEWIDDEDLRKLWEQVKEFNANPNLHEVSLSPLLNPSQRKQIHAMADKLKLTHFSNGDGEQRHICLKKPQQTSPSPVMMNGGGNGMVNSHSGHNIHVSLSSSLGQHNGHGTSSSSYGHMNGGNTANSAQNGSIPSSTMVGSGSSNNVSSQYLNVDNRGIEIKGRRRQNSDAMKSGTSPSGGGNSFGGSSVEGKYRSGSYSNKKNEPSTPTASDSHMDWRSPPPASPTTKNTPSEPFTSPSSSSSAAAAAAAAAIAPVRQPKGPDGSKGFTEIYKESRKTCGLQVGSVVVASEVSTSVST